MENNILKYSCFTTKTAGSVKTTEFLMGCFYFCLRCFFKLGGFTIFSLTDFHVYCVNISRKLQLQRKLIDLFCGGILNTRLFREIFVML